jgi:preprotein translocase subunit SecG
MQNVVLVIHLILALALIGVVLLQRSEGGGLGIGGAGNMGPQAGRPPLTGLAKLTWGFAAAFICTSLALTVIAARNSASTSVLDRIGVVPPPPPPASLPAPDLPVLPGVPGAPAAPLLPPRAD